MALPRRTTQTSRPGKAAANIAGVSTGTGVSGLALLLPEGWPRSLMLICSPAITFLVSSAWGVAEEIVSDFREDWRISRAKKRALALRNQYASANPPNQALLVQAQKLLDDCLTVELEASAKRISRIN